MSSELTHDVMQVCLRGHVVTDMLVSQPAQAANHCPLCGAPTVCNCQTCGQGIPGAAFVPGLSTVGQRVAPPFCPTCGAAFPWAEQRGDTPAPDTQQLLETLLRRLPCAIRQLRDRHHSRPTLKVDDVYDLEDLLRVVLQLHFDDVRRDTRTPSYAPATRTDFVVGPERIAVSVKLAAGRGTEAALQREVDEDVVHYGRRPDCGGLFVLVYDPEQVVFEPRRFETALRRRGDLDVSAVVAIPMG